MKDLFGQTIEEPKAKKAPKPIPQAPRPVLIEIEKPIRRYTIVKQSKYETWIINEN